MDFQIGETYEFKGELGEVVFKFLEEHDMFYRCEVIGGTMPHIGEVGSERNVYKQSRIFKEYKATKVGNLDFKSSGVVKRKRRTPDEIEVDNLIEHVQLTTKINALKNAIDDALTNGHRATFMALTNELNKLQKKVTA